jgi:hypothetical protein
MKFEGILEGGRSFGKGCFWEEGVVVWSGGEMMAFFEERGGGMVMGQSFTRKTLISIVF